MSTRAWAVCVAAVLLSSLVAFAFTAVPAHACEMPPIIISYLPVIGPGPDAVASTRPLGAEVKNNKVAVEMVLFMVDGKLVAVSKAPAEGTKYTTDWKTAGVADGEHQFTAAAVLADGSVLNSNVVSVVVKNEPAPAPKQ